MRCPDTAIFPGRQSPVRRPGGTQNKSSEFGPRIHPSSILELSVKSGEFDAESLIKSVISTLFEFLKELKPVLAKRNTYCDIP